MHEVITEKKGWSVGYSAGKVYTDYLCFNNVCDMYERWYFEILLGIESS